MSWHRHKESETAEPAGGMQGTRYLSRIGALLRSSLLLVVFLSLPGSLWAAPSTSSVAIGKPSATVAPNSSEPSAFGTASSLEWRLPEEPAIYHSAVLAQVTVRPESPKRKFEEQEDKPWTLWIGRAMLPATIGLLVFVVIWYVAKVTRTRYKKP